MTYDEAGGVAGGTLTRAGDSPRTASARLMVAVRRAKYGPSGLSPRGRAAIREAARRTVLARPRPTQCPHGHRYTAANTYRTPQGRQVCRACATLRRHRARWARLGATRLARLRAAMLRAHPDKGGTHDQFLRAHARYRRARAGTSYATKNGPA